MFVTTHSSVAVEQLDSCDLVIVRSSDGEVSASFVPSGVVFQATLRSRPSAFLANRIVVTEGKTEHGLLIGLIEKLDDRTDPEHISAVAYGVTVADGQGSSAPGRAKALADLGYEVALFADNDNRTSDKNVQKAQESGVTLFTWEHGKATEHQLVSALDVEALNSLLEVASRVRAGSATVKSDLLNAVSGAPDLSTLDVVQWIDGGPFTLDSARDLIAAAAIKSEWFKTVDAGRRLADFVIEHWEQLKDAPFGRTLQDLEEYIYPPEPDEEATPEPSPDEEAA